MKMVRVVTGLCPVPPGPSPATPQVLPSVIAVTAMAASSCHPSRLDAEEIHCGGPAFGDDGMG